MAKAPFPTGTVNATIELTPEQAIKSWLGETSTERVVPAVKAQGSITFHHLPKVGDTLTVNGVPFTFIAGASADQNIQIKSTPTAQAVEVAAVLNASTDGAVDDATYSVELNPLSGQSTNTIRVVHGTAGKAGNSFTLSSSGSGSLSRGDRVSRTGPKNSKLPAATIEVTPRLEGGHDASTGYVNVVENFFETK